MARKHHEEEKSQMADTPKSDKKAKNEPKPSKIPSPKRGAIPTPRAEIEKAKPYIPETDRAGDKSATEPVSPENVDSKEDSQEELDIPEEDRFGLTDLSSLPFAEGRERAGSFARPP